MLFRGSIVLREVSLLVSQALRVCVELNVLIDIGSTAIKGLAIQMGAVVNRISHHYDHRALEEQVEEVIDLLSARADFTEVMICSSYNGGLSIGILCLSNRVSGAATVNLLEAVGANIHYAIEWRKSNSARKRQVVDVLVIVGGIDAFSDDNARQELKKLDLDMFPHSRLVFAGHESLVGRVEERWSGVEVIRNPLEESVLPTNNDLSEYIRDSYLQDIHSKREIESLRKFTKKNIQPTPTVVSRAYRNLQDHFLPPFVIFDVGGATTDLHFSSELIDENRTSQTLGSYPPIARHVFTSYGFHLSKKSTIDRLIADERCMEFLSEYCGEEWRNVYLDLVEGKCGRKLLAATCIFLAAHDIAISGDRIPPINLGAIATIGVTGGVATMIEPEEVIIALSTAMGAQISGKVVLDRKYGWWGLGLLEDADLLTN